MSIVIDESTLAYQNRGKLPAELPHGLITPPAIVREYLERERAKFPPEVFARHEQNLLNDWTIDYAFGSLGHEVVYRRTPQGPEVLAVGFEEAVTLKNATPL